MSKREKIIVFLAIAAVLYGAYNFLLAPTPATRLQTPGKNLEDVNTFITGVVQGIQKRGISANDAEIMKRITARWPNDPMLSSTALLKPALKIKKEESIVLDVELVYSGYLTLGALSLAIINGIEYQVGEEIEEGGYIVERISPQKTTIRVKGTSKNIILPLGEGTPSKEETS